MIKNEVYRRKIAQYHNIRVKNKIFMFGDLVLRKLEVTNNRESKSKLASKWDGTFKFTRVVKPNTFYLQDMKGKSLFHA
jgi:hypothetical protein